MKKPTWWDRLASLVLPKDRTPEEIKHLADEAVRWLADPTLNTAIAKMRFDTVEAWRLSKDPVVRERAWIAMHQIDAFVGELGALIGDQEVQKDQEARAKRIRDAGL
jgi:hypothetical protein